MRLTLLRRTTIQLYNKTLNRFYSTNNGIQIELSNFLNKELEYELKNKKQVDPQLPLFLQQSGYQLNQEEGSSLVELNKKYNEKENIIVRFSIHELNQPPIQPENAGEVKLFSKYNEFPIRCHIILSKASSSPTLGKGSLLFDSIISDGFFGFIQIKRFENKEIQPTLPINQIHLNPKLIGLPFEVLHEEIKSSFEDYLEVRGVDHNMAKFIRDYISFKEQNEYMNWLSSIKQHVLI